MTNFVSYAQNFEDLMLWRCLKDIRNGFYIDVGACDPEMDSVTHAFYSRGWSGINLEPSPSLIKGFKAKRPRDINLECAAGKISSIAKFYDSNVRGWSSLSNKCKNDFTENSHKFREINVQVRKLADICEEHCPNRDIHFLKVDVEGFETDVLQGMDFTRFRPWIVVVESLDPRSDVHSHHEWEDILLNNKYTFAYQDGLNRFYTANEHQHLAQGFTFPPNIFDSFVLRRELETQEALNKANEKISKLLEHQMSSTTNLNAIILRIRAFCISRLKPILNPVIKHASHILRKYPRLRLLIFRCINLVPGLELKLRQYIKHQTALSYHSLNKTNFKQAEASAQIWQRNISKSEPVAKQLTIKQMYYYVDHTAACNVNTGIQRTARQIAKALQADSIELIYVKWDLKKNDFQLIDRTEIEQLSNFAGPSVEPSAYPDAHSPIYLSQYAEFKDIQWMFIPEVPHINFYNKDLTGKIIQKANEYNLRTAFIFYDSIPFRREELKNRMEVHTSYMNSLSAADAIFSISDWSKNDYLDYRSKYKATHTQQIVETLHLTAGFDTANTNMKPLIDGDYILSVGSITEHKNQMKLIEAFNAFAKKHPENNTHLLLAGNVHYTLQLSLNRELKNNPKIVLLNNPTDEQLMACYQHAIFTVFPSIEEGFGLPIVESIWFGKPCICANFGSMCEVGSKYNCVLIDTHSANEIEDAITKLIEDKKYRIALTQQARNAKLESWHDYATKLLSILSKQQATHKPSTISAKKQKRIFWLGMHKILVKTELVRLRELGYEVFNPPYLTDIVDQSAELAWDQKQNSTLPNEIFDKLSNTNFFYVDTLEDETVTILNTYFDAVIVTISPTWLAPVLQNYNGTVIYRVYGQVHSITHELLRLNLKKQIDKNENFYFLPHAQEAVQHEASWLRKHESVVPYCLPDDVFGYIDSWVGIENATGEIAVSCPNIANHFFEQHYQYLKKHFNEDYFKIYGVQVAEVNDSAVVGTLPRHQLLNALKNSAAYLYTYDDPKVCYLPPIECMVIGVPVLFRAGSLLEKYFSDVDTPARFKSEKQAKQLLNRILNKDTMFISEVLRAQLEIRKRYQPAYVWPTFDETFKKILG